MDASRFDALAKAWSTTRPRRALLKGLAGGIGAGLLATLGVKPAAGACVQYGRACGRDGDCCSENCLDGKCACRVGKTRCGTRCIDLRYNENHCGACDTPCPEGQQCRNGECGCAQNGTACTRDETCCSKNCVDGACACPKGQTRCGTRCVNTATDKANCGACDTRCPEGLTCRDGQCSCSQYGRACKGDETCCSKNCVDGACTCAKGQTRCGTRCVNTATDEANCGGCGNACAAAKRCANGGCTTCPSPTAECRDHDSSGTVCVNLQTAELHCSACGHKCVEPDQCVKGRCEPAVCPPGTSVTCMCSTMSAPGEVFAICCPPHPGGCPEGTFAATCDSSRGCNNDTACVHRCCDDRGCTPV